MASVVLLAVLVVLVLPTLVSILPAILALVIILLLMGGSTLLSGVCVGPRGVQPTVVLLPVLNALVVGGGRVVLDFRAAVSGTHLVAPFHHADLLPPAVVVGHESIILAGAMAIVLVVEHAMRCWVGRR